MDLLTQSEKVMLKLSSKSKKKLSSKHSAITTTKIRQSNIVLVLTLRVTQVLDLKFRE